MHMCNSAHRSCDSHMTIFSVNIPPLIPPRRVMDINLKSVLFLSQCVVKDMVERGDGGAIVNVSSQAAQCALPQHTVYCESAFVGTDCVSLFPSLSPPSFPSGTAKAGLDMLTKMMGLELGPHKVRQRGGGGREREREGQKNKLEIPGRIPLQC